MRARSVCGKSGKTSALYDWRCGLWLEKCSFITIDVSCTKRSFRAKSRLAVFPFARALCACMCSAKFKHFHISTISCVCVCGCVRRALQPPRIRSSRFSVLAVLVAHVRLFAHGSTLNVLCLGQAERRGNYIWKIWITQSIWIKCKNWCGWDTNAVCDGTGAMSVTECSLSCKYPSKLYGTFNFMQWSYVSHLQFSCLHRQFDQPKRMLGAELRRKVEKKMTKRRELKWAVASYTIITHAVTYSPTRLTHK